MKPLINTINTTDGKFHRRNKHTGELSTIVTADYMNDSQEALRSLQNEVIAVLAEAGYLPSEINSDQLLNAIRDILGMKFDELGTAAKKDVNRDPKKPDKGAVLCVGDLGIGEPILIPAEGKLADFLASAQGLFYVTAGNAFFFSDKPEWFDNHEVIFVFVQGSGHFYGPEAKYVRLWNHLGQEAFCIFKSVSGGGTHHPEFSGWKRAYTELHPPTAAKVGAYAKSESDKRFQPVGDYQPKGDYAAADHAYSKVESDQRYLSSNTSIPPPVSLAGYATEQWVNATHPGRNEVASDTRIIKGPALRYIEGNPQASVDIPSGGFLLRHSITNGQHDMQYGFMQQLFGSNWVTIRERA